MSLENLPVDIWENVIRVDDSTRFLRLTLVSKFFNRIYWQNCSSIVLRKNIDVDWMMEALSRLSESHVRTIIFRRSHQIDKVISFNRAHSELMGLITQKFHFLEYLEGVTLLPQTALALIRNCSYLRKFEICPGHFTQAVTEEIVKLQYLESFEFYHNSSRLAYLSNINTTPNQSVLIQFITSPPPHLRYLNLTMCASDTILQVLCTSLPHLESLVLDQSPITAKFIPLLLKSLQELQKLSLISTNIEMTDEIFDLVLGHPFLNKNYTLLSFLSTMNVSKDMIDKILLHLGKSRAY